MKYPKLEGPTLYNFLPRTNLNSSSQLEQAVRGKGEVGFLIFEEAQDALLELSNNIG